MKTLFRSAPHFLLLAACAGFGFTTPTATPALLSTDATTVTSPLASISQVADYVFVVRVSNPARQKGKVQLVRLSDGARIYQRHSSDVSFGCKLNVRDLANGRYEPLDEQYEFVVQVGKETHRYPVNLSGQQSAPTSNQVVTAHK